MAVQIGEKKDAQTSYIWQYQLCIPNELLSSEGHTVTKVNPVDK